MLVGIDAMAARFDADHFHGRIVKKRVKQADRVRSAADRGHQHIGQAAFGGENLFAGFLADHRLEIAHQFRIGVRTGGGADDVERVVHVGDPVAQRFVHRVLQRLRAAFHRDHFRAQQLHAEDVGLLAGHVGRAHVDHAGQAEPGADGGRGDAMLARAGFGNDPRLAHADGEENLADAIVDLVRAGVIEFLALEIDFRPFAFGASSRKCAVSRSA